MKRQVLYLLLLLIPVAGLMPATACAGSEAIHEDFDTLDNWVPVYFPKIKNHSQYSVEKIDNGSILVARSNDSASGIRYVKEFDVYKYPVVRWRWKVDHVYLKGDVEKKIGDDYPLRVYITFKYDPDSASFAEKLKYGIAKAVYGAYPPQSSLNYIWANRHHDRRIYTSTYTDRAKLIILRSGNDQAGKWVDEQVNIIEDYEKAFGEKPPETASIAIMNDSDNTGEHSVSYMDYIEVVGQD